MGYATSGGVRIHYAVEGSGPPLVLQHGFGQTLEDWRLAGYVAALAPSYRLVLVDARGHGRSDKPHDEAAYGQAACVADVVAVLDALGLERAHFWGYSRGGWIGFGMAEFARHRLLGLVIGGQHAFGRQRRPDRPDGSDPVRFFTALFAGLGLDFAATPAEERQRWLANDTVALARSVIDRPSQEHLLPGMTMPCLLYAGDADAVLEPARRSAAAMPGARFEALPGLDHALGFDRSALVLPKVLDFLRHAGSAAG